MTDQEQNPDKKMRPRADGTASSADVSGASLVLVDDGDLFSLQARPSLGSYVGLLWHRRHFIAAQARAKSLRTGQDTFLGKVWIVLTPLISIAVYTLVFGLVLNTSRGMENFIGFLTIGVIYFGFVTKGTSAGSGLIQGSKSMIAAFSIPKASLVLATAFRMFVDNLAPAIIALIGAVALQLDKPLHWTTVLVIPLYVLLHLFIAGLVFIGARITAFVPDFKSVITVINRGLFFVSGVFFSVERFATQPLVGEIMTANPIYQFLKSFRECIMVGTVPTVGTWLYLAAWSIGALLLGFVFFWQAEERYSSVK